MARHWHNRRCRLEGLELAHFLVDVILDKKGTDILLIDIQEQSVFTDFFLLCSGDNKRQLETLAENVALEAKQKAGAMPWGIEGEPESGWILVDFGGVIVHIFSPEQRLYYDLEDLWRDGHVVLRMQ